MFVSQEAAVDVGRIDEVIWSTDIRNPVQVGTSGFCPPEDTLTRYTYIAHPTNQS